jgi:hypothetical protein
MTRHQTFVIKAKLIFFLDNPIMSKIVHVIFYAMSEMMSPVQLWSHVIMCVVCDYK